MAVRIRKSVWALVAAGDPALSWYRRAVAAMIARPVTDPTSWRYLASVHGVPQGQTVPPAAKKFWDKCNHQNWFFLPWHRGYVASFEAIVAKTVAGLGGPADWALPYWDYSEPLAANPKARLMPPDLFNRTLPGGAPNALWSRRAAVQGGNFALDNATVTLAALGYTNFANSNPGVPSGFGGPATALNPGTGNGGVENLPHNRIHVKIGGQTGFMSDPATAALDPIFWLHHCNIDRLWEVWRNQGAQYRNPTGAPWLSGTGFAMHDANGAAFTFFSKDMLDTTKVMHGYRYDNVPVAKPSPIRPAMGFTVAEAETAELAGANKGPVGLDQDVTRTMVSLAPKLKKKSFAAAHLPDPDHIYLNLENITGTGIPGDYKVYIDMPDDNAEPAFAGIMTTFGIERASSTEGTHGGSGMTQVLEITELAKRLGISDGTIAKLQVSFVREGLPPSEEGMPEGLEDYGPALDRPASVQVGRVSLFYS